MKKFMLQAALAYAALGWLVFPLVPRTKKPMIKNGFKGATTSASIITTWWKRYPTANVAIATGAESGLVVLDVDPRNDGDESLARLEADHGALPETATALTGGGGTHSVYAHPPGRSVPNRKDLGGYRGLDLKGGGGYIVAPPSLHASGREYAWNVLLHPDELPLAPCPEILLRLADGTKQAPCATYRHVPWNGQLPPRVHALLREDRRVRERFYRRSAQLVDATPSGIDFALARALAWRRLSGAEIECAIRASRAMAQLPSRAPSYYAATVGKALGGVHG